MVPYFEIHGSIYKQELSISVDNLKMDSTKWNKRWYVIANVKRKTNGLDWTDGIGKTFISIQKDLTRWKQVARPL